MSWNILIVDDAAFVREALIRICQASGHLVVGEAVNGLDAVAKAKALHPDVIIMDLVLPDMNGVQATREILEALPQILVVACTSVDQEFLIASARQAGAVRFLEKPFRKQEVIDILEVLRTLGKTADGGGSHV